MIPKKIHYCWFGPKPLPKLVLKCIETWKIHFPDYEFHLWNESNSPMEVPYVAEAYAAKKYAFVSDYVRFWALHNEGGVYLDTDMYVVKSFDELLTNKSFFGYEIENKDIIGCCVVGCLQGDSFINKILDKYHTLHFRIEDVESLVIPRLITPIFEKYDRKQDICIFPYDYFYPFPYVERDNISNFKQYIEQTTFAVHLWNLSWVNHYDKIKSEIVSKCKAIINYLFH